ncbi:hypothetical protein HJG60_008385 [Phyllostomus discolor]|uniref:Uncharacterized protein n=1 Tax=Phyllostomus discolor TaxID=89673 RepID=A0A834DNB0_9CHIR|nr:hypothetical protein HJG60_008385 [Phyllostomus discolor]
MLCIKKGCRQGRCCCRCWFRAAGTQPTQLTTGVTASEKLWTPGGGGRLHTGGQGWRDAGETATWAGGTQPWQVEVPANTGSQRERKYGETCMGSRQLFPQLRGRQPEGVLVLGFVKDPWGVAPQGAAGACGVSPACRDLSNNRRLSGAEHSTQL